MELIKKEHIHVMALNETRVRQTNIDKVKRSLTKGWEWVCNYQFSPKERIWVGWNSQVVKAKLVCCSIQSITIKVSNKQGYVKVVITCVYGLHTVSDRKGLGKDLVDLNIIGSPWLILGCFNTVFEPEHWLNGSPVTVQEVTNGLQCVQQLGVDFVKSIGQLGDSENRISQGLISV